MWQVAYAKKTNFVFDGIAIQNGTLTPSINAFRQKQKSSSHLKNLQVLSITIPGLPPFMPNKRQYKLNVELNVPFMCVSKCMKYLPLTSSVYQ